MLIGPPAVQIERHLVVIRGLKDERGNRKKDVGTDRGHRKRHPGAQPVGVVEHPCWFLKKMLANCDAGGESRGPIHSLPQLVDDLSGGPVGLGVLPVPVHRQIGISRVAVQNNLQSSSP